MRTKFISGEQNVWSSIKTLFGNGRRGYVAVAYIGQGASRRLKLKRGSILVTNASEAAVRGGQTSPSELLKFYKRGVQVFSQENLHAKVFVAGKVAIVGSANISNFSENILNEAVLITTETHAVKKARAFVDNLSLVAPLGPALLHKLKSLYRPPKVGAVHFNRQKKNGLWLVSLTSQDWDEKETQASNKGRPIARKRLANSSRFRIEEFCWSGKRVISKLKDRQELAQVVKGKDRKKRLHPIGRILHIQKFRTRYGAAAIVFVETSNSQRPKLLIQCRKKLGSSFQIISRISSARFITATQIIASIRNIFSFHK